MKKIFLILFLCYISTDISGQKILYGINFDKLYPEIKSEGTKNLYKVVVLKDKSVFYEVKISSYDFVFSAVHDGFEPFKNPQKFYKKGLFDVKKVFGEPISIFTDSSFLNLASDFYLWKVKRKQGYFFIYYGLSGFGLSLNIDKLDDEKAVNEKIRNSIYSHTLYTGRTLYIKTKELNMPDWD